MPDNDIDLPEGTDKVIAGASRTDSPSPDTFVEERPIPAPTGGSDSPAIGAAGAGSSAGGDLSGSAGSPTSGGSAPSTGSGSASGGTGNASTSNAGGASGASGTSSGSAGTVAERLRSGRERLMSEGGERARGLLSQGLGRSAEALSSVSRMVGDTATGLDDRLGSEYGDYARRAASAIDNVANAIGTKDPDELIDDARGLVRNSPGVALAGAAVVGFVLARLVKTGLGTTGTSSGSDDDQASDDQA